jgi:hypothetical protein
MRRILFGPRLSDAFWASGLASAIAVAAMLAFDLKGIGWLYGIWAPLMLVRETIVWRKYGSPVERSEL